MVPMQERGGTGCTSVAQASCFPVEMALLKILQYPDPRLRVKCVPVTQVDDRIRQLLSDMAETMYSAPGVGLAAPQVGESLQICVVDIAEEDKPSELHEFINPEIIAREGKVEIEEGCLSFPNLSEPIPRAATIVVRWMDRDGQTRQETFKDMLAVAIQHELDHLTGTLMIDRLGPLRKMMAQRKMNKKQSVAAQA